jgi:hypothetical protein
MKDLLLLFYLHHTISIAARTSHSSESRRKGRTHEAQVVRIFDVVDYFANLLRTQLGPIDRIGDTEPLLAKKPERSSSKLSKT